MSKNKSIFVTALFAVMLAAIDAGLYKLFPIGFVLLTGTLALYGFWQLAKAFMGWLVYHDEPLALPEIRTEPVGVDEGFSATFDEIMAEMEAEREAVS